MTLTGRAMGNLVKRLGAGALLLILIVAGLGASAAHVEDPPSRESLAGQFLVATPELNDPNFDHTVVYMIEHDATGAMGLVVNRVLGSGPLVKLLQGFGMETEGDPQNDIRIYYGGPVERGQIFVLHSPEYRREGTVDLAGGIAMTNSLDVLRDVAEGRGPKQYLLALGYAGWAPNQLESEIASGSWIVIPADPGLLFDEDPHTVWQRAIARRGVDL